MKEEIVNERQCETEDEKIDIQQLLFKYIIHPCYNARIPFILESKRETFS